MTCMATVLAVDQVQVSELCRRFRIAKLELFGSRASGHARPDSDVDLLVTFEDGYTPGLEFFGMADAFAAVFGHPVDLLTRRTVERDHNEYFRHNVLSQVETLYAA